MKIREYIQSGVLEAYLIGSASKQDAAELLKLKDQYPEVQTSLEEIEEDMERIAEYMAVPPPPGLWNRIEDNINDLVYSPEFKPVKIEERNQSNSRAGDQLFIEVKGSSTHMRIHKLWRWVFAGVFILGKVFLGFAIYYYLENRQAQQQVTELKTELSLKR